MEFSKQLLGNAPSQHFCASIKNMVFFVMLHSFKITSDFYLGLQIFFFHLRQELLRRVVMRPSGKGRVFRIL